MPNKSSIICGEDRKREERPQYRSAKSLNSDRWKLISRYSHELWPRGASVVGGVAGIATSQGARRARLRDRIETSSWSWFPSRCSALRYHGIRDFPFNFRLIIIMEWPRPEALSWHASATGAKRLFHPQRAKSKGIMKRPPRPVYRPNGQIYAYGFHSF